jgi:hypothetical protein
MEFSDNKIGQAEKLLSQAVNILQEIKSKKDEYLRCLSEAKTLFENSEDKLLTADSVQDIPKIPLNEKSKIKTSILRSETKGSTTSLDKKISKKENPIKNKGSVTEWANKIIPMFKEKAQVFTKEIVAMFLENVPDKDKKAARNRIDQAIRYLHHVKKLIRKVSGTGKNGPWELMPK